jgi:hypothetical protein
MTSSKATPPSPADLSLEHDIVAVTQAQLQWRKQRLRYVRSEARHKGLITEAILMWRRKSLRVEVENVSRRGLMICFEGPLAVGKTFCWSSTATAALAAQCIGCGTGAPALL